MMKKIGKVVGLALGVLVVLYGMFRLGVHVVQYPPAPHVKAGKIHIACVGDSITYGAGVLGHRRSQSYPAYLQENLGEKYQVLNYGLSGRTLMDEGDVPYRSEKLYQKSLDAKADIYLLMLGTNDAKDYQWDEDAYAKEIKDFVEAYQTAAPQAKIYLMQPPRAFSTQKDGSIKYGIQDAVIGGQMLEIIADTAEQMGVGYIDLYQLTKDHSEWLPDGIHPNAEGNKAIADYIYECIERQ